MCGGGGGVGLFFSRQPILQREKRGRPIAFQCGSVPEL